MILQAQKQVSAARAEKRMAEADKAIAAAQAGEANANAAAARAAAREAEVVQDYTRIVSPASGVVTARLAAPGTLVQSGMPVLKIAEIDHVRVQANVAVADLAGIGVGSPVTIAVAGALGSAPADARVTAVFPSANDQTRTAVVEAVLPNPGHKLLPGAFVTMRIAKAAQSGKLLVPAEAIVSEGGQSYVWVARGADGPQPAQAATRYKATGCGMLYSAADAKKYNYVCPMDHSKIVPVAPAATPSAPSGPLAVHRIAIQAGASDGAWTEATADDLLPNERVVRHGQAGLTEDAKVTAAAWGPDGPKAMPTAAQVASGETRYRCEVCGLTFSAEDAKMHNYRDPMEGGRLVPIKP
jgi:multidrug efflux pump subunit AcrA (membrane-fusion protein)